MVLGLYFCAIWDCSVLTPKESPLGWILADWSMYSCNSLTKKKLAFYCNTAWPMYILDYGGKMTPNWFSKLLHCHTVDIVLPMDREMVQNPLCPGIYGTKSLMSMHL